MISDGEARRLAAHWHSPSPHDSEITRVSHGLGGVDWGLFLVQVADNMPARLAHLGDQPDDEAMSEAWQELTDLIEWGRAKLEEEEER